MAVLIPSAADAATAAQLSARAAALSAVEAQAQAALATLAAAVKVTDKFYGLLGSNPGSKPSGAPSEDGDIYYNSVTRALMMRVDNTWSVIALSVAAGVLVAGQNLNDVSSKSASRANLGLGTAATKNVGTADGVAGLGGDGKVPAAQLDIPAAGGLTIDNNLSDVDDGPTALANLGAGTAALLDAGEVNGVASLDGNGLVPMAQLKGGVADGVATLDALGHVPQTQLNAGEADGIATLDSGGVIPLAQLPDIGSAPTTIAKAGDYTTLAGDSGQVIAVTTGSSVDVSITLISAATAGDGETMIVQKVDSGTKKVIVLDSNGSTNLAWLSNQWDIVVFRSNGSSWTLYRGNISPRVDIYTANGTWTKPPLARLVYVELFGSGGGGGSGASGSSPGNMLGGEGGGGAARIAEWFRAVDLSSSEAVVCPVGGVGGTGSASNAGGDGGDGAVTTFGTSTPKLKAGGGKGGAGGAKSTTPATPKGAGGSQLAVDTVIAIADATAFEGAAARAATAGLPGYCAYFGGASGGVSSTTTTAGAGGSSLLGGAAGGAGGGRDDSVVYRTPGAGGKRNAYTPGGGGSAGTSGVGATAGGDGSAVGVGGGGSGSSSSGGVRPAGGRGGVGAGGGGSGATGSGTAGGPGGAGGTGQATITTVF